MQQFNLNVGTSQDHLLHRPNRSSATIASPLPSTSSLVPSKPLTFNTTVGRPSNYFLSSSSSSSLLPIVSSEPETTYIKPVLKGSGEGVIQHQQAHRRALGNLTNAPSMELKLPAPYYQKKSVERVSGASGGGIIGHHRHQQDSSTRPSSVTEAPRLPKFNPFGPNSLNTRFEQQSSTKNDTSLGLPSSTTLVVSEPTSFITPSSSITGGLSLTAVAPPTFSSGSVRPLAPPSVVPSSFMFGANTSSSTIGSDTLVTRHICIGNIKSDSDSRAVMRIIESAGDVKSTYPDFLHSIGMLTVTYYDLREAASAIGALNSFVSSKFHQGVQANYISDSKLAQLYAVPLQDSRSASTAIITLYGPHDRLITFNYKEFFDTWGATRSTTEMEFSGIRRTIQVEFYDQRAAANVAADLHNQVSQGITFQVCSTWRDNTFTSPDCGIFDSPTSLSSSTSAGYFTANTGNTTPAPMGSSNIQQDSHHPPPSSQQQYYQHQLLSQQVVSNEQQPIHLDMMEQLYSTHHPNPALYRAFHSNDLPLPPQSLNHTSTGNFCGNVQQQHSRATTANSCSAAAVGSSFSLFANTPLFRSRDSLLLSPNSPEQQSAYPPNIGSGSLSQTYSPVVTTAATQPVASLSTPIVKGEVETPVWHEQYSNNSSSYKGHSLNITSGNTTTVHTTFSRTTTSMSSSTSSLHQRRSVSTSARHDTKSTPTPQSQENTFNMDRVLEGIDKRTTFMIRNIPNKYTQAMLKECIDATHQGTYDFLYLRIDFQNKCNVGYAFINFIDVKSVVTFAQERVGKRWNRFNSEKRCSISYANIQGKGALVEKFRNSTVMDEEESYRPKIFYSSGPQIGEEEPFPEPTIPADVRRQRQEQRWHRESVG